MKKILISLICSLWLLSSCDFSIYNTNSSSTWKPIEIEDNLSGRMKGYSAIKISEITLDNNYFEDMSAISEAELLSIVINDLAISSQNGYFVQILEGLGYSVDEFFDSEHLKPRKLQASLELHAEDEGFYIKDGYSYKYDLNLQHLDLISSVGFVDALKFYFNYSSDDYSYVGSPIKADGSLDISIKAYGKGENIPCIASSGYLSVNADDISFASFKMSIDGNNIILFIPNNGGLKFQAHLSVGKSHIIIPNNNNNNNDNVAGFPPLSRYVNNSNRAIYFPYRIWIDIKETQMVDCNVLYKELTKLLKNTNSFTNETAYNRIAQILWPNSSGSNIVLGIDYADGRSIVIKDWELVQFLFFN